MWHKKQPKRRLTDAEYEDIVLFLLKRTMEVTQDTAETLENQIDADEQSKLPKVEEELCYFFMFALNYWWQKDPSHTPEQNRIFGQTFGATWAALGGADEGSAQLDTLQERFIAYGQIVNEHKSDSAKFLNFGAKLSQYCDLPSPLFLVVTPSLFTKALELVSKF